MESERILNKKNSIQSVCVYCASSTKVAAHYIATAQNLGRILAERHIRLINGAGAVGLMGAINDACLEAGGEVTGIIPKFMIERGWCHRGLTECIATNDMHERKERMTHNADALIALPGGIGTMEELLEALTWKQLGLLPKPIVILNTNGYYDSLLKMLERAISDQFMRSIHRKLWTVAKTPKEAVEQILNAEPWDNNIQKLAQV